MFILQVALLVMALNPLQGWDSSIVAVKVDPDQPAVMMKREEAEAKFQELCRSPADSRLLAALAIALDKFPDWPAFVLNGERSACPKQ